MMSMQKTSIVTALALIAGGCAASGPSQQLVDARRAVAQAGHGPANQVVPAHVLYSRQVLSQAEAAHEADPGSPEERSLAYVAQRRAEIAMTYADWVRAQQARASAEQAYKSVLETQRDEALSELEQNRDQLDRTRSQLSDIRSQLAQAGETAGDRSQKLRAQEHQLAQQQAELEARQAELERERSARDAAERRADEALQQLREIAQLQKDARGDVITIPGTLLFRTGSAELLPGARIKLDQVATALKLQDREKSITIFGHTDAVGSDEDNLALSRERAESVRSYLSAQGLESSRMTAVGKGESEPIGDNTTAEGRANNRRVEIVVSSTPDEGASPESR